jgi:hypothetical protein
MGLYPRERLRDFLFKILNQWRFSVSKKEAASRQQKSPTPA